MKMKMPECIFFIGKFKKLWDEECIARSFEDLGIRVIRQEENVIGKEILPKIIEAKPDLVMFAKLQLANDPMWLLRELKKLKIPTVSWTFDLYFDYVREINVPHYAFMKADHVFTTDGGHEEKFKKHNINHHCLRQGIYEPEAVLIEGNRDIDVLFVGSDNPHHPYRAALMKFLEMTYPKFKWVGRYNTDEARSMALNELFGQAKIVIGDSVYSPNYWSNRVYESLGRGAFLITPDVPGLDQEFKYYEHLVPYKLWDFDGLKKKIDHYLTHEQEREKIRRAGFEFTKENYSYKKRCEKLLQVITGTKE